MIHTNLFAARAGVQGERCDVCHTAIQAGHPIYLMRDGTLHCSTRCAAEHQQQTDQRLLALVK